MVKEMAKTFDCVPDQYENWRKVMAARRPYTYRRRGPQEDERSMDPEQNATDGINMEEGRELPNVAEPQRNNSMESFNQMMERICSWRASK
ncbi:hypothetical protein MA16_Dca020476 [Dendrobium catenatum]|uniref:Uncharacterized protein n=1 Tax=Dendrobium catenatum TaxID=906689 RepID=A0A2I0WIC2_9ASPA|nr:hypothetical protein MA16_Dca020476 [Dendrobium catenatum]